MTATDTRLARLLRRALPQGGAVVAMYEGYFDESYRDDEPPETFVVAGYFMSDDAAAVFQDEWMAMLEQYGLPYFHMVDVAHGRGTCEGMNKQCRVSLQTQAIKLVKQHTIRGFAAIASQSSYEGFEDGDNLYPRFADMAVTGLEKFMHIARVEDQKAYFFEAGHANEKSASVRIAERLRDTGDSVTFGGKRQFAPLQAADLLAWHCRKYVQDWVSSERKPRKDFLSLMEHPHAFFHVLTGKDGQDVLGVEIWPLSERAPFTSTLSLDSDGPVSIMREGGDGVPIIPVQRPVAWKMGAGRMAYVLFEDLGGNEFALAFDEPRLTEAVYFLAMAMGKAWDRVPMLSFDKIGIAERKEGHVVLEFEALGGDMRIAIGVPEDEFLRFMGMEGDSTP